MPDLKFKCICVTIGLFGCLLGCSGNKNKAEMLLGSWKNLDLKVLINHQNKTDSAYSFEVPEGEWEATLNIKPILTEFNKDRTYRSEYRSLEDSIIRETEGTWRLVKDTLVLIEQGTATRYHMQIDSTIVTFSGWLDWDQDGENDDLYQGRQEKVASP